MFSLILNDSSLYSTKLSQRVTMGLLTSVFTKLVLSFYIAKVIIAFICFDFPIFIAIVRHDVLWTNLLHIHSQSHILSQLKFGSIYSGSTLVLTTILSDLKRHQACLKQDGVFCYKLSCTFSVTMIIPASLSCSALFGN